MGNVLLNDERNHSKIKDGLIRSRSRVVKRKTTKSRDTVVTKQTEGYGANTLKTNVINLKKQSLQKIKSLAPKSTALSVSSSEYK